VKGIGVATLLLVAALGTGCFHDVSPLVDPGAVDEVAFQRARAAYDAGKFDEARYRFDEFVREFGDSERHAEAWYLAGRCRYELGKFEDAIGVLVEMRTAYPESAFVMNASYYVGRCEYEAKRYDEAEAELAAFEVTYPDSEYSDDSAYYLGRTFYDRDRFADAIAPLDRVVALESEGFIVPASYYVGRSRYELADFAGAIGDFRRVLAYEPAGMFGDNAQYYIGRSLFDAGDLEGAEPELVLAEQNYPDSDYLDSIEYTLGRCYYDRSRFADATRPFARLAEIEATTLRDDGLFLLGRSRYEIGDLQRALYPMNEIEQTLPDSSFVDNSQYWQARIYTDLHDCTSARAARDRLAVEFPTSSELSRANTYLAGHGC
jgi:TolA-binding protein